MKRLIVFFVSTFIFINCFSFKSYAGVLQDYAVSQQDVSKMSDEALKDLFGQSGYRVASQEEIDKIRQYASTNNPELFSKYPLIFGGSPDSREVTPELEEELQHELNSGQPTSIYEKIGVDFFKFVDNYISYLKSNIVSPPSVPSSIPGDVTVDKGFNFAQSITGVSLSVTSGSDTRNFYISFSAPTKSLTFDSSVTSTSGVDAWGKPYVYYDTQIFLVTDTGEVKQVSRISNEGTAIYPTYDVLTTYVKSIDYGGQQEENDDLQSYVPYPTTQDELTDTTKLPHEISLPIDTSTDTSTGTTTVTPSFPEVTYPSTQVKPSTDGITKVGNSTVTYTSPTIDTSGNVTGTVDTNTETDTNTDTSDNTTQIPSTNVPTGDVPTLNFQPLEIATRKFPFCIPWDIYDTIALLNVDSECPKIHVSSVSYGSFVIIPDYDFDLASIPHLDEIVTIFRFFEVLVFLFFLYLNTRSHLIRG